VEVAQEAEAVFRKGNTWTRSGRRVETVILQRLGWIPRPLVTASRAVNCDPSCSLRRPIGRPDPLLCPHATTLTTGVATREHRLDGMSA